MYNDKIFESAKQEARDESIKSLKCEVKSVESVIEKFLTQMLECTSSISERDFNVCGV